MWHGNIGMESSIFLEGQRSPHPRFHCLVYNF